MRLIFVIIILSGPILFFLKYYGPTNDDKIEKNEKISLPNKVDKEENVKSEAKEIADLVRKNAPKSSSLQKREFFKIIYNSPVDKLKPSNNCNYPICKSLLKSIQEAKYTIDFAIYGLRGQDKILNALKDAQKRGVIIRAVIDKDAEGNNYYSDTYKIEQKIKNVKTDYNSDKSTYQKLKNRKIFPDSKKCKRPTKTKGPLQCFEGIGYASKEKIIFKGNIMHNKFFIFDNKLVWSGSANISDTGTGGYNANAVFLLRNEKLVKFYTKEFNQMYIKEIYHTEKSELGTKKISGKNNSEIELYFSPSDKTTGKILDLIDNSRLSIDVTIFFLTHKKISLALKRARDRGVKVRVILDATAATNGYSKHEYLRQNNIALKVENWGGKMHMKAAMFDNKHIVLGSMNWTKAGEKYNDENTIIIKNDAEEAKKFRVFFEKLWESIPNHWLNNDPMPESKDSINSCNDNIDNDFDKKIDNQDYGCRT